MIERAILRKLLEVEDIPTLPEVVERVLDVTTNTGTSAQDLTGVLECDHAISARVLRLANSAFYGLRSEVETIRRAVVVIGFDQVRLIALATSVFDALSSRRQFALDPTDFWMHSLGAAKAAQLLSVGVGRPDSSGPAFTSGLLHDIGKYLLALTLGDEYRQVVQEAEQAGTSLQAVERRVLKTTCLEVGGWVAEKWRFPQIIIDSIRHHGRFGLYTGTWRREVAIVSLADSMSRLAEYGKAGDMDVPEIDPNVLQVLRLNEPFVQALLTKLTASHEEARELLSILREDY